MSFKLRSKIFLGGILLATLAGGFFYYTKVYSQENLGIPKGVQVSPARFDWDLSSGDEKVGMINLKNYSDEEYEVEVSVEDFYVADDSSQAQFFVPDKNHPYYAYDVINWIDFPDKKLILSPKEGKDITFHVKVPEETPTGGYYGAIFFKTKTKENSSQENASKIMVNQRVGVLLVMAVKGSEPLIRGAEMKSFFPTKKIYWGNPAELSAKVYNSGNLHFRAYGKIDILKFGKNLTSIDLTPRVLYPKKVRTYNEKWDFTPWSYGFYKARISMASEDGELNFSKETSFWVIPWKTTVSIILLLAIVYLILRIFSKKFEITLKSKRDNKKES